MDSASPLTLPDANKREATIRFTQVGIQPPVFVVTSMSSPPWEPLEMHHTTESKQYHFYRDFHGVSCGDHQYKFRLGDGPHWIVDVMAPTTIDSAGNENNCICVQSPSASPKSINLKTNPIMAKAQEGNPEFDVKILNARLRFNLNDDVPSDLSTDRAMALGIPQSRHVTPSEQLAIVEEIETFEDSEDNDQTSTSVNERTSSERAHRWSFRESYLGHKSLYALWVVICAAGGALLAGAWVFFGNPAGAEPL